MIRNPEELSIRLLRRIIGGRVVGLGSEEAWRIMAFCRVAGTGDRDDGRFVG